MSDVYILTVREPSEERVRWGSWQASIREQLNHVAVMILEHLHKNPGPPVVFEILGENSRTIRFTCPYIGPLNTITEYSRELGLEVVLGPVERPDTAQEQLAREISHTPWYILERRAASGEFDEEWMQLARLELGRRGIYFASEVRSWDAERIAERLRNSLLAAAERRILEEEAAGR